MKKLFLALAFVGVYGVSMAMSTVSTVNVGENQVTMVADEKEAKPAKTEAKSEAKTDAKAKGEGCGEAKAKSEGCGGEAKKECGSKCGEKK